MCDREKDIFLLFFVNENERKKEHETKEDEIMRNKHWMNAC